MFIVTNLFVDIGQSNAVGLTEGRLTDIVVTEPDENPEDPEDYDAGWDSGLVGCLAVGVGWGCINGGLSFIRFIGSRLGEVAVCM